MHSGLWKLRLFPGFITEKNVFTYFVHDLNDSQASKLMDGVIDMCAHSS